MMSLLLSAAVVVASTVALSAPPKWDPAKVPEELRHIPNVWLGNSWTSNLQEAHLLIDAYDLGEDVLPAFWHLFYLRMAEEYEFEKANLGGLTDDTSEEEALRWLSEFVDRMPMKPDKLCDMVELLFEEGDYSAQRRRFAELRARRDALTWLDEDNRLRASGFRRRLKQHRLSHVNLLPGSGKPIPTWAHFRLQLETAHKLEQEQLAEDAHAAAARRRASRAPNSATQGRPAAASLGRTLTPALSLEGRGGNGALAGTSMDGETADPLVAAHEDATYHTWRAALRSCLARPGLSDADRQSARKVFDEGWSKAQAYRQLHKADYEQIASLTSHKAHQERLLTLDKPLEGLFAEFSVRLAAIGPRPARTTAAPR